MAFSLPTIHDNAEGWGPAIDDVPDKYRDTPFAPFNKGDKVGKAADFTGTHTRGSGRERYRETQPGTPLFNYSHPEEDDSFHLVDSKSSTKSRQSYYGGGYFAGGRMGRTFVGGRGRRDRSMFEKDVLGGGRGQRGGSRSGANKMKRTAQWGESRRWEGSRGVVQPRESSVTIQPDWRLIETIDFASLSKATLQVDEPQDLAFCGQLEYYDKSYDRVGTKHAKPLERIDRVVYRVTTTDDLKIKQFAIEGNYTGPVVFGIDTVLAALMTASRSVYSWDIVVTKVGNKIFLDKRDNSPFDLLSVNETANFPPTTDEKDLVNSPQNLAQEATYINHNFTQQVLLRGGKAYKCPEPNPFASSDAATTASVAYRYRRWNLGDNITLVARCELDAVAGGDSSADTAFLLIRALNETDPKLTGIDWRQKLDSQRSAVLATELKNNSSKLARWMAQALLAGASQIRLGYVSRVQPRDSYSHVILGVQSFLPKEFMSQIGLNAAHMWGTLRAVIDLLVDLDDGKYVLLKDPNKGAIHLYEVPEDQLEASGEEPVQDEEFEGAEEPAEQP